MSSFLRSQRVQFRVSQAELAKQLGVSQQTVARWETTGQIPAKYLKDLAVTLGAQVDDFLPKVDALQAPHRVAEEPREQDEDDLLPFGDVCIRFVGAADSEARYYPVTYGTMQRIEEELGDAGCGFLKGAAWFQFEALNNKWVAINAAQVERVTFIDDDVESMTNYEHDEVYKAARRLWNCMPTTEEMAADDFPYSKKLVAQVEKLVKPEDETLWELEGMVCGFTSGSQARHLLSKPAANSLLFLFDSVEPSDILPTTFLNLSFPDEGASENLRLGSLRFIEVARQALNEKAK